jgi:hypothetical protein
MGKLASLFDRHDFRSLRLDGIQPVPGVSGPGIVIVACEKEQDALPQVVYELLDVREAEAPAESAATLIRAAELAPRCSGQIVAWLAFIPDHSQRRSAVADFQEILRKADGKQ